MTQTRPPDLWAHPRVLLRGAVRVFGPERIGLWCIGLLAGRVPPDAPDEPALTWLGGRHAEQLLATRGADLGDQAYWPRVWAARGLLHEWAPAAAPVVVAALDDPAWRVREMAAKVVRRFELGEAGDRLALLVADDVPRVRAAAARAIGDVGEAEHADALYEGADDPDDEVRRAARLALSSMRRRLDRDL
ncbi:HEAT repeat domain-containing protein [Jidongwangia harbinensis]|uniref:HEAT repeat domain-containing protein n=1 Tax=Jidongwangia harbinensis TaxID=2878561 RepID=UPI001CDA4516|nr:HEAT repeat domain-containing protein [Jidongwangia harbinensis]MCA2218376.1 HEAT repeat domain-containing protein [Jidongwangia harbinensis]